LIKRYPINSKGKCVIGILKHLYVTQTEDFDEYILEKLLAHHWYIMFIQYYIRAYIFNADNVAWYYFYVWKVNKNIDFFKDQSIKLNSFIYRNFHILAYYMHILVIYFAPEVMMIAKF